MTVLTLVSLVARLWTSNGAAVKDTFCKNLASKETVMKAKEQENALSEFNCIGVICFDLHISEILT